MNDHDYFCECDECTEEMYASLDRANAALKKWGAGPIITRNLPPRPAPKEAGRGGPKMNARLFDVREETWWALSDGPNATKLKMTIRPHRRRSWTPEALTAAIDHVKATPPHDFIILGSNTNEILKRIKRRLPRGSWS